MPGFWKNSTPLRHAGIKRASGTRKQLYNLEHVGSQIPLQRSREQGREVTGMRLTIEIRFDVIRDVK